MKVRIDLMQQTYGKRFDVVMTPVDAKDEKRLKRKLNYNYKKYGLDCLIADVENIRLPEED